MKLAKYFVFFALMSTSCNVVSTPNPTALQTATISPKAQIITPSITSPPDPTQTKTSIPSSTPTATATAIPTSTPEPTEDPRDALITQALADGIGPDWHSFIEWREDRQHYFITMVSDGEYLDYVNDPVNIPVSEDPDQNPEMLVGTKAYYLDLQGDKQEVILPIVMRLTDDRLYWLGPYQSNIVDWPLDEIMDNVPDEELQKKHSGAIGGLKGEIIKAFHIPNENVVAYYRSHGINPLGDPYNILDKLNEQYQETHKEELEAFITSGKPPSSGIFLPSSQNGMLGDDGVVNLP